MAAQPHTRSGSALLALLAVAGLVSCVDTTTQKTSTPTSPAEPVSRCPVAPAALDAPVIAVAVGVTDKERSTTLDRQRAAAFGQILDNGFKTGAQLVVEFMGTGGSAISEGLIGVGPNGTLREANRDCRRKRLEAAFAGTSTTKVPADILGGLVTLIQHVRALGPRPRTDVVVLSDLLNQAPPLDLTDWAAPDQDSGAVLTELKGRGLVTACERGWRWSLAGGGRTAAGDADNRTADLLRRFWVEYVYHCGSVPVLYDTELTFPAVGGPVDHPADAPRRPTTSKKGTTLELTLGSDGVLFDSGSHELRVGAETALTDALAQLDEYRGAITVEGHTDNRGSGNLALSQRRAITVRAWLTAHGIAADRIRPVKGLGDTVPVADNGTEDGRRLNRRVVVLVDTSP